MKEEEAINSNTPSSSSYNDDEDGPIFRTSFITRLLQITPIIELFGYMKDHRKHYKEHWIDSCKDDPERLKATLLAQYEMEIVLAVLYLSIIIGVMTSVMGKYVLNESVKP